MAEHPEPSAQERAGKAFPVSWDQFHRDCRALTWRLNEVGPFQAVIAITRGGLVPAAIVARELGVRIIDTVCIASYDHTKQGDLKVLKSISKDTRSLPEMALNENRRAQAATRSGHFPQDPRALRRLQEIFRRLPR